MKLKNLIKRIFPLPAYNANLAEKRILSELANLRNVIETTKVDLQKILFQQTLHTIEEEKSHLTDGLHFCNICGYNGTGWGNVGNNARIFKNYHIIGGGIRENAMCPQCGSADRYRWLYFVLKNKTPLFYAGGTVLHFAPEKPVADRIMACNNVDYYTGDIEKGVAMHITDITDIQYKDSVFDYVICNHVMEHIKDEKKAVEEIKRVLKPDGRWIFSFPVCTDLAETFEDDSISSEEERWEKYGQGDHVRLYGMDFAERFSKYGFDLQIFTPKNELNEIEIKRNSFIADDIIILARKNKRI